MMRIYFEDVIYRRRTVGWVLWSALSQSRPSQRICVASNYYLSSAFIQESRNSSHTRSSIPLDRSGLEDRHTGSILLAATAAAAVVRRRCAEEKMPKRKKTNVGKGGGGGGGEDSSKSKVFKVRVEKGLRCLLLRKNNEESSSTRDDQTASAAQRSELYNFQCT